MRDSIRNHHSLPERKAYKVRWVLLAGIAMLTVCYLYMGLSFALTNEIVAAYLQVTSYQVDVLALVDTCAAAFICLVMAAAGERFGIRVQTLVCSVCLFIAATLSAIAFTRRDLYWWLVFARFVAGISTGLLYVLPATVANSWFPPQEIATAFSIPLASGFIIGNFLTALIFSNLLPNTAKSATETPDSMNASIEFIDVHRVGVVYTSNMSVIAVLTAVTTVTMCVYAKDRPPTPPSGAEEQILDGKTVSDHSEATRKSSIVSGFYPVVRLLRNRQFLLLTAANTLSCSAATLSLVLSASMVHITFPMIDNRATGVLVLVVSIVGGFGGFIAGKAMDKFGEYKLFAASGTFVTVLLSVCVYLGHYFRSVGTLFVFYPLLLFSRTFTTTTDVEFLVEATYPNEMNTLTSLHFAFFNLGIFSFGSLERLVMNKWGAVNAPLVPVFCHTLAFVCLVLVPADYKRSAANRNREEIKNEIDPLLENE